MSCFHRLRVPYLYICYAGLVLQQHLSEEPLEASQGALQTSQAPAGGGEGAGTGGHARHSAGGDHHQGTPNSDQAGEMSQSVGAILAT